MKKYSVVIIVLFYTFISVNTIFATPDTWTQKTDFGGTVRYGAVGFSIGSKGYIGTGGYWSGSWSYYKDFWEYDPATNAWTQKADFGGTARYTAVGFSIGNKGFIGTGYDGSPKKDFWEYDPALNTWTQKTDFGGTARYFAINFSIGSKGYIGTGYNNGSYYKDLWEYDPALNTWTQKTDFGGTERSAAVGFSIGTKGYVGTGVYFSGSWLYYNDFWEYDPALNTWTQKANFGGMERQYAVGFSIGTKGYIGTGSVKKDFWEYDPALNTWTQKTDFGGTARQQAVGFSIGTKGYIGTGYDSSHKKDFWEYDSGRESFYGSFTGYGVWMREGTTWSQVTSDNPEAMAVSGTTFYGDFGASGVWMREGTTWSQVTSDNPEAMVVSGTTFYGDFGASGVWMREGTTWSQVTSDNPESMAVSGTTFYGDFGVNGVWMREGTTWSQVTSDNPASMVVSGTTFYGDFGVNGVWMRQGTTWSQVTSDNPEAMVVSGSDFYGDFGASGVWMREGTTWSQVTSDNPEAMAVSGTTFYGDFGASGVWMREGTTWSQVTSDNPASMVTEPPPSGSLDSSFGTGGIVTTAVGVNDAHANALGIQTDGKIVVSGYYNNDVSYYDFALVRYNSNGSLDSSFGTGGIVTTPIGSGYDEADALGIQSDGKIVVAGRSNSNFAIVRYNTDGNLDTTFGTGGIVTTPVGFDYAHALGIQSDGKIVVAGRSGNDFGIVRYNTNGSLDTSFDGDGKVTTPISVSASVNALVIQPDGKIVAAGDSYNGSYSDFALVRYNADGNLDTTFDGDGKVTTHVGISNNNINALGIQPDGKIVAAGYSYNGSKYNFTLARYNANGSLDSSFGTGGIVTTAVGSSKNNFVNALGIQPDGKIVAAGYSDSGTDGDKNYDFTLVRYNSNGSLDSSFGTGGIVITPVESCAYNWDVAFALGIQPDGKIDAAGGSCKGNIVFTLLRYWP